jgi:hypothetical protein
MDDTHCTLFEICQVLEAPLCPLQEHTIRYGIWYPDEAICRAKRFQEVPWIKKQKQIAKRKLSADDGFFTVRMLNALRVLPKEIKGANPDDPNPEETWFNERHAGPKAIKSNDESKSSDTIATESHRKKRRRA